MSADPVPLTAASIRQLAWPVAWRTLLLGGIYGAVLGALYGVLYAFPFFFLPFTAAPPPGAPQSSQPGFISFALAGLLSVAGAPLGLVMGGLWGLAAGLPEAILLIGVTALFFIGHWRCSTYKWVAVVTTLVFIGSAHGLLFSGNLQFPATSDRSTRVVVLWLLNHLLPVLLATAAFGHISYLVARWVMTPPGMRSRRLV